MPKPVKQNKDSIRTEPAKMTKALRDYMRQIGTKGGRISGENRMTSLTPEVRSKVALAAAKARWAKVKKENPS